MTDSRVAQPRLDVASGILASALAEMGGPR